MTDRELLEHLLQEMYDIAYEWRMDWSDFDGRTLLAQVECLEDKVERARETGVWEKEEE